MPGRHHVSCRRPGLRDRRAGHVADLHVARLHVDRTGRRTACPVDAAAHEQAGRLRVAGRGERALRLGRHVEAGGPEAEISAERDRAGARRRVERQVPGHEDGKALVAAHRVDGVRGGEPGAGDVGRGLARRSRAGLVGMDVAGRPGGAECDRRRSGQRGQGNNGDNGRAQSPARPERQRERRRGSKKNSTECHAPPPNHSTVAMRTWPSAPPTELSRLEFWTSRRSAVKSFRQHFNSSNYKMAFIGARRKIKHVSVMIGRGSRSLVVGL
jgi:hypothetical protein